MITSRTTGFSRPLSVEQVFDEFVSEGAVISWTVETVHHYDLIAAFRINEQSRRLAYIPPFPKASQKPIIISYRDIINRPRIGVMLSTQLRGEVWIRSLPQVFYANHLIPLSASWFEYLESSPNRQKFQTFAKKVLSETL